MPYGYGGSIVCEIHDYMIPIDREYRWSDICYERPLLPISNEFV